MVGRSLKSPLRQVCIGGMERFFIYFSLNLPGETFATFKETLRLAHAIGQMYPPHLLRMLNPCHTLAPYRP